jgi:SAM-dependent methyltransferase
MQAYPDRPVIVDRRAHLEFENAARACGYDPSNRWVGGYVDYQWQKIRHLLVELPGDPAQTRIMEFGCNFGAGAVTAAMLGMRVTALDVDADLVRIARLNAERYGVADRIEFRHVHDTRTLPFEAEAFDLVICCSVLEYVDANALAGVQREIDRVTADGGIILVTATSNRLSPCEVHSRLWLLNYVPRAFDALTGKALPRGVFPWTVRYGFGRCYENLDYLDAGRTFIRAREAFGMSRSALSVLRLLNLLCRASGFSVGMLLPNMSMTLRKRRAL